MAPSHCAAPYVYSDVKGLYEKNGIKAGPFKDKGVPMVTTQATGIKGGAITVRKDSGIKDIEDLG